MEISLPDTRYPSSEARIAFHRRVVDAVRALPGVRSVAASSTLPLSGNDMGIGFRIEGRPVGDDDHNNAAYHAISPDYFATMAIRRLRGRVFTERDDEHGRGVIVINDTMARTYWPNEDPLGKRITVSYGNTGPREVVGIVADVKESAVSEPPRAAMYTPFAQTPWPFFHRRRSRRTRPGAARRCVADHDHAPRSRAAARRRPDTRLLRARSDGAAALHRDARRGLCAACDRARRAGDLRRPRLRCCAAAPRDRHPLGARRAPPTSARSSSARR